MAAVVTKTIKSAGGDYSSLSAFEAGEQADITAATGNDTIVKAECYSFQDTTAVTFYGWTTAAGNYIEVYTPALERHDGKWNTGKYRLEPGLNPGKSFYIAEQHVRADGLQIKVEADSGTHYGFRADAIVSGDSDHRISNCIIQGVISGTATITGIDMIDSDSVNIYIWNTIVYALTGGSGSTGIFINGTAPVIYNCTVADCNIGIRSGGTNAVVAKNCVVFNNVDDFNGIFNTIDHCASDDGDGTNAVTPADWANVFVDHTNGDFHLKSTDTDLIGAGVDDPGSGLYSDDIDGETRTSTWDIGADEYVVTAVTKTVTDTGMGTDAVAQIQASLSVSDVGSGSDDVAQILASITVNDTGQGIETSPSPTGGVEAYIPVSDVGHGEDAIGAISVLLTVLETATGSDAVAVIGAIKAILLTMSAKKPSVTFTGKKPSVTFTGKKPDVDFDPVN